MIATTRIARSILVQGQVQGIGFRPAVYRWARACEIAGNVSNTAAGVLIHIEGEDHALERFIAKFFREMPSQARIQQWKVEEVEPLGLCDFSVATSEHGTNLAALVPPDRAVCLQCLNELFDRSNRRYHHPFISCTDCGPRFSILHAMPFDRESTSLAAFSLCAQCQAEYHNPADRRFHAQTISCRTCGPRLRFVRSDGSIMECDDDAIAAASAILRDAGVLAIKGLGGYQLLADATSPAAVDRIRQFKRRPDKSLAIMVRDTASAESLASFSTAELHWLSSSHNPVVVVRSSSKCIVAKNIAPGLNTLGIFLPTTPLHALLLANVDKPLIVTSGNRDGQPLCMDEANAETELCEIVDAWLHHDRPIVRPLDDSVMRVIAERPSILRLGRGFAPLPLELPDTAQGISILAVGGEQKSAFAMSNGHQAILGPYLGDLQGVENIRRWHQELDAYQDLFRVHPSVIAHDAHPEYYSTRWAKVKTLSRLAVQHHQSHIAAAMLAHGWLEREVVGFAWDGTGWGSNGVIWGGEVFWGEARKLMHVAQVRPFILPGGEQAIREPWRCAVSLLSQCGIDLATITAWNVPRTNIERVAALCQPPDLSPRTSSVGRLFDAAAALIINRTHASYEGQAALELESACDESETQSYPVFLHHVGQRMQLDWRPLFTELYSDLQAGCSPGKMAMRFHRALAGVVVELVSLHPQTPVVLAGGVFQNCVLTSLIAQWCTANDRQLGWGGLIPPGDGGLAAGQLAMTTRLKNAFV